MADQEAQPNDTDTFKIPFVEVDGTKYFSDRFYLNTTIHDAVSNTPLTSDAYRSYNKNCSCGGRIPPPLFDREELINSLDLQACVIGTYNINLSWLSTTFPQLCGPNATVPTLCLHGQKGLAKKIEGLQNQRGEADDDSSAEDCDVNLVPEEGWRRTQKSDTMAGSLSFGNQFYLSQVLPRWLPPRYRPPQTPDGSWREMHPKVKDKRVRKRGVHHPKFMILFCKDNSVIVLVSTSNLGPPLTTDGTWLQKSER